MKCVLESFRPLSGKHCVTTSMSQVFAHHGYPLSEELLFGLASGLHFFFFEFKFMDYPLIGGRTKIGEFENRLADRLGITITLNKTSSVKKARTALVEQLREGAPVLIYVDMGYLSYLHLPDNVHFGGHTIVVFGVDEENGMAYVSDRDGKGLRVTLSDDEQPDDFHLVPFEELERARGSKEKPYPPENKWIEFDFDGIRSIDRTNIYPAIQEVVQNNLEPPIRNLGNSGIGRFADNISGWKDYDHERLKLAAFNCYIMINKIGGTGGGAFRNMYGHFLHEAAQLTNNNQLESVGKEFIDLSIRWDSVAAELHAISEKGHTDTLPEIRSELLAIAEKEKAVLQSLHSAID